MWSISRQVSDLSDPSVTICSICKFHFSTKRGLFIIDYVHTDNVNT